MGNIEQVKKILENKNISVSVSVLDYSKGEIKPAKDTFCGTIVSSDVDKLATEINALYSEPQVCPKPEQMMICPKVETCKLEKHQPCFAPNHSIPHIKEGSCDSCSAYCPACIPVPSTPAKPQLSVKDVVESREYQRFIHQSDPYEDASEGMEQKLDNIIKYSKVICERVDSGLALGEHLDISPLRQAIIEAETIDLVHLIEIIDILIAYVNKTRIFYKVPLLYDGLDLAESLKRFKDTV
jgi:hypothetical protein